ncbi:MAG: NUDIX hydrolase [Candidatus Brocadiae bacterium]|nr:NUDIX hydrolase [Candidatus Brocadiia bacterium]
MKHTRKNPATTVDIVVMRSHKEKVEILFIQRKNPPFQGNWALPGGFVEMDETCLTAAHRELEEETSLKGLSLQPLGIFDKVDRDPRGRTISMVYWTILVAPNKAKASSDAADAHWFAIDSLPSLAFDHLDIIVSLKRQMSLYSCALPLLDAAPEMKAKNIKEILIPFLEKK